ncbi:MAG: hypothetical protein LBF16_10445 [Pseudomonadales bacterium]|jgi:phospholipase C|nr:hypothetical protein [Pseudomonadales bacterium]
MPFTLPHTLISEGLYPETHENPDGSFYFTVTASGNFTVHYPGQLSTDVAVRVRNSEPLQAPPNIAPPTLPLGIDGVPETYGSIRNPAPSISPLMASKPTVYEEEIPLDFRLFDPSGQRFTGSEVTLADVRRFRDLRGTPLPWRYTLSGTSRAYLPIVEFNQTVVALEGTLNLSLLETVPSVSAPPLVPSSRFNSAEGFSTHFDLNRVGFFMASLFVPVGNTWSGVLRLTDPDGKLIASSNTPGLRCKITLELLRPSRDANGNPRLWTLAAVPTNAAPANDRAATPGDTVAYRSVPGLATPGSTTTGTLPLAQFPLGGGGGSPPPPDNFEMFVTATVLGEGRISTTTLQERVQKLLGPQGQYLEFYGDNRDGEARLMLKINNTLAAETLDMHGVFDTLLKNQHRTIDIEVGKPITLFSLNANLGYWAWLDVSTVKVRSIDLKLGPGTDGAGIGSAIPALRLSIKIDGAVKVKWGPLELASATLKNGEAAIELGIKIDPDGTPRIVQWLSTDPFKIEFSTLLIAALAEAVSAYFGVVGLFAAVVAAEDIEDLIDDIINKSIVEGAAKLFNNPALAARLLMIFFGAHLTHLQPRFEGLHNEDILFEHIALAEPDRKPNHHYVAAIGRTRSATAFHPSFEPPLGDTWKADNLKKKIKHIVVVMMENRSYDHVLGYRAQASFNEGSDGLTPQMMNAINAAAAGADPSASRPPVPVHPLRIAKFEPNYFNEKTCIPLAVGHEQDDVREQLANQVAGPDQRRINAPKGFMDNFLKRIEGARKEALARDPHNPEFSTPATMLGCTPSTVLGYYEKNDLPITAFLAENYTYCDRYFSSHPGPTLPNRMYSLTGDVQYDRLGVPILDNNHGDNFLLSRATTIYDLLTRKGVGWRVYESAPSVTMLRMFARYATDNTHIKAFDDFAADVASNNLPELTVIEPAMHHRPQNDDHPNADMHRGQCFLQKVYNTLRSNPTLWRDTLLLITYDEHGGFYDHVVPPLAEVLDSLQWNTVYAAAAPLTPGVDNTVSSGAANSSAASGNVSGNGNVSGSGNTATSVSAKTLTADLRQININRPVMKFDTAVPEPTSTPAPAPTTVSIEVPQNLRDLALSPESLRIMQGDFTTTEPIVPDTTLDIPYGIRVPTLVVSPWVKPGTRPDVILDHCSILKTILARFCGDEQPFLSDRVRFSHSFESFLTATAPNMDVGPYFPELEDLPEHTPSPTPVTAPVPAPAPVSASTNSATATTTTTTTTTGTTTTVGTKISVTGFTDLSNRRAPTTGVLESSVLEPAVPTPTPPPPAPPPDPTSTPSAIITAPLYRRQMRTGTIDYHDLSGRLARMLGR